VDAFLYRLVNRLADDTPFAHPLVVAYAKYGLVLFAAVLLAVPPRSATFVTIL
jgi:hypothetical protein